MPDSMLGLALIGTRAVHFASTAQLAGLFLFLSLVAEPALGRAGQGGLPALAALRGRLLRLAGWSLALSAVSGAAWLLLVAARIAGSSPAQAISGGAAQAVLTRTQFGYVWELRCVGALLLTVVLLRLGGKLGGKPGWAWIARYAATALAAALLASLAWSGHGGATPGMWGKVHVAADVLHLVAVGAWLGGLLPLRLLLLSTAQVVQTSGLQTPGAQTAEPQTSGTQIAGPQIPGTQSSETRSSEIQTTGTVEPTIAIALARDAAQRFSTLGVTAVATLVLTGLINVWALAGNVSALADSSYGRLLVLKLAIFLAMLGVAAANRLRLVPRLAGAARRSDGKDRGPDGNAARQRLERNCLVEAALGLMVLLVVGALGLLAPGMDM